MKTPEQKARAKKAYDKWYASHRDEYLALRRARHASNPDKPKESKAKYRANNKNKIIAYNKEYYARNPKLHSQRFKKWYEENKDEANARWRDYYLANKPKIRAKKIEYLAANSEKIKEYAKNYRLKNPQVFRNQVHTRRARLRNNMGVVSKDIESKLFRLQNGKCAACKCNLSKYQLDHIYPIAKGGKHDDNNLQLLCKPCNQSKNAKHPVDFMQQLGYLL